MVSPYVAAAARRATKFELGSVWRPRRGHKDGWHDYIIIAITNHPTCPIIGQTSIGSVMSFGLDGRADGDPEFDSDADLVTLVRLGSAAEAEIKRLPPVINLVIDGWHGRPCDTEPSDD